MRILGSAIFGSQNLLLHACHTEELVQLVLTASPDLNNGAEVDRDESKELWHHFNPMVASYWLMDLHFHNPYTYLECEDGTCVEFLQDSGWLFVGIGKNGSTSKGIDLQQYLRVYAAFAQHVAGPGFQLLQNPRTSATLTRLIDVWLDLRQKEVFAAVQGIEQIPLSSDLAGFCVSTLENALTDFHHSTGTSLSYLQGVFLLEHRLMSIYAGPGAPEISSSGILFLVVFIKAFNQESSCTSQLLHSTVEGGSGNLLLFLPTTEQTWLPLKVVIQPIRSKVLLILLEQVTSHTLISSAFDLITVVNDMERSELPQEKKLPIRKALKQACRRLMQLAKKAAANSAENPSKLEEDLGEVSRYLEKNASDSQLKEQRVLNRVRLALDDFFSELNTFVVLSDDREELLSQISDRVFQQLNPSGEFSQLCSFPVERSIGKTDFATFPELVHFIYVDRSTTAGNTILMPCYTQENDFHQEQIFNMISQAVSDMKEGKLWSTWTDEVFRYSHVILMEPSPGQLVPLESVLEAQECLGVPGIIGHDSYGQIVQRLNLSKNKRKKEVKCHELFCLHLALTSPETVLEQCRRLPKVANFWLGSKPAFDFDFLL